METIAFNEEVKGIFNASYEETFTESVAMLESKRIYLTEAKKAYPHLNESFLIENRVLMEDIRVASVSDRCVMEAYQVNLAQARTINKSFKALAIAEHFARTEKDEELFNEKLNKACGDILLLEAEAEFDPEQRIPSDFKYDAEKGKAAVDAEKAAAAPAPTDAPKEGPLAASIVPAAGVDPAKADAKKKGFIAGAKDFLTKSWKIVVAVSKSKEFYKALAMGAIMVILGLVASTLGGWFAIGFGAVKALLGLFSVYKGAKELIKTSDFAQGKKGIEGVKEWIAASKDPKNATKIIVAVAKIALGSWGASSAVSGIIKDVVALDVAKAGAAPAAPASAPQAQAPAPHDAVAAPPTDILSQGDKIGSTMQTIRTAFTQHPGTASQYLENPDKYINKILGHFPNISPDTPVEQVIRGVKATGGMTIRDYLEQSLEGAAKAAKMASYAK